MTTFSKTLLVLAAICLPPVAVMIRQGLSMQLALNIVLTLLGFIPGVVHALWAVFNSTDLETEEEFTVPARATLDSWQVWT